jgi:hypothetical protein
MGANRLGSILHGAYGDYYEQMICLKAHKDSRPGTKLILFFASPSRLRELNVFDLSFADEVHLATELPRVPVDQFLQFQVRDPELQANVLAALDPALRSRIDDGIHRKPWIWLRKLDLRDPRNHIGLSDEGRARMPSLLEKEGLDEALFRTKPTVGFLWRYRGRGGAVAPWLQTNEAVVLATKSELLRQLQKLYLAHVIVAGMDLLRTEENRERVDAKFTDKRLDLDDGACTYLKGLSWGLELEIMRQCTLCLVMPSGFSEALWITRKGPTQLVDSPPAYVVKALWNRMPLFGLNRVPEVWFQLRQPHTMPRVIARLGAQGHLPLHP